jgi:uncharacterized protein YaiE (UPF0345 family)
MINVNEYFEGKVKSLAFDSGEGRATVGVMVKGEYQFGTNSMEIMKIISGKLLVKLPGKDKFKTYGPGGKFTVLKDQKFDV